VIELTDEMVSAFEAVQGTDPLGNLTRAGLTAVLALVERDYLAKPTCVCLGSDWPHVPSSIRCTPPVADGTHRYLSTSCLHGQHDYCKATTGRVGPKTPAVCKFCDAPCICTVCHDQAGRS
jgi:hypothetical protein